MSMINNAHAGSKINLLCLIYRVIHRNNAKLSVEQLKDLCAPENLFTRKDHEKRFRQNLEFWMGSKHQLWKVNEKQKLELIYKSKGPTPTPADIAHITNISLFKTLVKDFPHAEKNNETESLLCGLSLFCALNNLVFPLDKYLSQVVINDIYARWLTGIDSPNDSEKPTLLEYGEFLGFLIKHGDDKYTVDPTQVVLSFLPEIFKDHKLLPINHFLSLLCERIPVLDGGVYREEVELIMTKEGWEQLGHRKISRSLSHAVHRLSMMKKIKITSSSDDEESMELTFFDKNIIISHIEFLGSKS